MKIDIRLTNQELSTLEEGGFIKLSLPDGLEILIRKDRDARNTLSMLRQEE